METVIEACRLCARLYANPKELEFVNLFEPHKGLENSVQFILHQLKGWQINVNIGDGLPIRICANCFEKFCDINSFRQECVQAQQNILQYYMNAKENHINHNNNNIHLSNNNHSNHNNSNNNNSDKQNNNICAGHDGDVNSLKVEIDQNSESYRINNSNNNEIKLITNDANLYSSNIDISSNSVNINFESTHDVNNSHNNNNNHLNQNGLGLDTMELISNLTTSDLFLNHPINNIEDFENVLKSENFQTTHNQIENQDTLNNTSNISKNTNSNNMNNSNINNCIINNNNNKNNNNNNNTSNINNNYNNNNDNNVINKLVDDQDLETFLKGNVIKKSIKEKVPYENNNTLKIQSAISIQSKNLKTAKQLLNINENQQKVLISEPKTTNIEDDMVQNDNEDDVDSTPKCIQSGIPLACQYCYCHGRDFVENLIYPNDEALSQHYFDIHDPNLPYNCPFCIETFKAPKQRDYHVQKEHYSLLPLAECEYCHRKITTNIEIHQFTCSFIGNWHCQICNEKFTNTTLSRYRAHQRIHEASKQYRCRVCNRDFVRRANLEAHERTHQLDHVVMIPCNNCGESLPSEYELKRHKYQYHGGELPVKCDHCQKGFATIAFLNRHLTRFHPEKINNNHYKDLNKKCTNCGALFQTVQKLRAHLQRPKDENGNCVQFTIMKMEPNEISLSKDKRKDKIPGLLYACKECPKRFYLKTQLEKHLNTHDACLRPHLCTECNVRCRSKYELQEHINVSHLSVKPLDCKTCAKRFVYKKDLIAHEQLHSDLIIKCKEPYCAFVCKNDKDLNDHISLKHQTSICDFCGLSIPRQKILDHVRMQHRDEFTEEIDEMHLLHADDDNEGILNDMEISGNEDISSVLNADTTLNSESTNLDLMSNTDSATNQYFVNTLLDLMDHEIIIK